MPNQKKTFTYQVKVFRDSPKEIAKRIEIKYYCSENSTPIEHDLNVTMTLENAWEGFSVDYQSKNVTSDRYQEIYDSETDDTGTDDAASKIYYVIKQNRFHDNVETPIYQTLQPLYHRLKIKYPRLRFSHLEAEIINVYQTIRSGTKEWLTDQGLEPSRKPLASGAQEHLDDIRKVIDAYRAGLDAEE